MQDETTAGDLDPDEPVDATAGDLKPDTPTVPIDPYENAPGGSRADDIAREAERERDHTEDSQGTEEPE